MFQAGVCTRTTQYVMCSSKSSFEFGILYSMLPLKTLFDCHGVFVNESIKT